MHYQAMLVGQFLKAAEFGVGTMPAQPTLEISDVTLDKLESIAMNDADGGGAGKLKTKGIVHFRGVDRGWVLNRTNAECLAAIFGTETNDWVGKFVTLYAASVKVGPKMDLGIRVKGSPHLDRPQTVQVKLPRRKPVPMTLQPTAPEYAAALRGTAALKAWWEAAAPAVKGPLKGSLDALKALARAADESRTRAPSVAHAPAAEAVSDFEDAPTTDLAGGSLPTYAEISDAIRKAKTPEAITAAMNSAQHLPVSQREELGIMADEATEALGVAA